MELNRYAYTANNPVNFRDPSGYTTYILTLRPSQDSSPALLITGRQVGVGLGVAAVAAVLFLMADIAADIATGEETTTDVPDENKIDEFLDWLRNNGGGPDWGKITIKWLITLITILESARRISDPNVQTDPDDDEDDDNCREGMSREEAAQAYADMARDYFDRLTDELGFAPPLTIAVTRAKEAPGSNVCRYYVGMNNVLRNPTRIEQQHWGEARDLLDVWVIPTLFGNSNLRNGQGPEGHAEVNLYEGLTNSGIDVTEIGLTQPTCLACRGYFTGTGVVFRYAR
jgi:hypothetical protein